MGATATGFSRAIRVRMHLNISSHRTSRRIHNTIILPGNANGAMEALIVTGNSGTTTTRTTNSSCINTRSVVTGVRGRG